MVKLRFSVTDAIAVGPRAPADLGGARPLRPARRMANSPPIWTGVLGFGVMALAFLLWPRGLFGSEQGDYIGFLGISLAAMVLSDALIFRCWRNPDAGLIFAAPLTRAGFVAHLQARMAQVEVICCKVLGLAATLAIAWLLCQTLPLFQEPLYTPFVTLFTNWLPQIAALLGVYLIVLHLLSAQAEDGWYAFGLWLLTLGQRGARAEVADHALVTTIKLFFLPLMLGYGLQDWHYFYTAGPAANTPGAIFDLLYRLAFFTDVCFGIIGYTLTARLLGNHIRWPEQSVSGWLVCLVCYAPFWQVIGRSYLSYGDGTLWGNVFTEGSVPYLLWGGAILILTWIYAFSTVSFGLRFSNLTYRGTVFRGPYRYVKHPAYLCKNLSYWMIEMPFLAITPLAALSHCLALLGVNLLYFLRARHEERCCGQHRDYRLYTRWIRRYSPVYRGLRAVQLRVLPRG